jgi:hypothetical protein
MTNNASQASSPERIWLIHDKDADEPITWADNPNPYAAYGEQPDAAVEYVRVASQASPEQAKVGRVAQVLWPLVEWSEYADAVSAAEAVLAALSTDDERREREEIISAWAFAHDIDGAARNDLFKRLAALAPKEGDGNV